MTIGSQFGRFILERELGTGGMGRVHRAHDPTLNRSVAIKVLVDAQEARDRLLEEARSASKLNHPNICTIYEIGEVDGVPFIAMELVEGQPLSSRLTGGGLPADDVTRIGLQVAAALAHAHDRGVVHGDLKPQNVMMTSGGSIKLLDFGLARSLDPVSFESITRAVDSPLQQAVAGTLPYMAPEVLRGRRPQPAADVWAFGVMLYELAAGARPFSGQSPFELADRILNASAPPLPSSMPAIAAVISRCLHKDPAMRYATARDIVVALETVAAGSAAPGLPSRRRRGARVLAFGAVIAASVWVYMWAIRPVSTPAPGTPILSLVVLPFDNLSPDSGEDYVAEGMTDALITDLSRLPNLRVISRTSSVRYKTLGKSTQEIARELGVEAIVDGSVLRAGDQVRISVRLVDAASDRNRWGRDYTREIRDVLALQADVARAIANEIRATFLPADERRFAAAAAVDAGAVEEYLKGRHHWNRRTPASLLQALAHFREAVRRQPDYAAAHAAIAETLVVLPAFPISAMSPQEALPQARASAELAIARDNRLAEAHAALGYVRLHSFDPAGAEDSFRQALAVNSSHATAHFWYAAALAAGGRFDEALAEARRAETLDPVSPIIVSGTSWMHHLARRFDGEVEAARRALALDPNFLMAHYRLGEGLLHQGYGAEAAASFERARKLSDDSPDLTAAVIFAYGRIGRSREARALLSKLLETRAAKTRYVSAYALALAYTGLQDRKEALVWLQRARDERAWGLAFLGVEPDFDPLRSDPQFAAILAMRDREK